MKWWLISDEDVRKLADSMVIGPGRDWVGPNGQEEKQAFFDDMEHTLLTGLHETDAVPADFQPLVTVHADPSMLPETAAALSEMTRLAMEMVSERGG